MNVHSKKDITTIWISSISMWKSLGAMEEIIHHVILIIASHSIKMKISILKINDGQHNHLHRK